MIPASLNLSKNEDPNTNELLEILKQQLSNSRKLGTLPGNSDNALSQILMAGAHSRTTSTVDSIQGHSPTSNPLNVKLTQVWTDKNDYSSEERRALTGSFSLALWITYNRITKTTNDAPRIKYYQNEVSNLPTHKILSQPSFFLRKRWRLREESKH